MKRERKAISVLFKDEGDGEGEGQAGEFVAQFSKFNAIDHDREVTRPGAFTEGAEVIIGSYGHKTSDLPVGRGKIVTDDDAARVEGRFFLDTPHGEATYRTVKNLGELQEWSYVFEVAKQSIEDFDGEEEVRILEQIEVFSVDPVLAGAGSETGTLAIKGRDLTFLEHTEQLGELVEEYLARVAKEREARGELKEGRVFSTANVNRLTAIAESLKGASGDLEAMLAASSSPKGKDDDELVAGFLRYQQLRTRQLAGAR